MTRFLWRKQSAHGDRRGSVAVEFAFILPVVATMLIGLYDIGYAVQQRLMLQQAVRAGGQFALSFPTLPAGMMQSIQNALPPEWTDVIVSVPAVCGCPAAPPSSDCAPDCELGETPETFVTLTVSRPFGALMLATILPRSTASYVVQVQ